MTPSSVKNQNQILYSGLWHQTSGIYHDVLQEIESQLNFTMALYKRKGGGWGNVYPQNNGSYKATGMIGDIFFKRAEFVVAPITINLKRGLYIDYAISFTKEPVGLFIKSNSLQGEFDFYLLSLPFRYVLTHSRYSYVLYMMLFLPSDMISGWWLPLQL